MNGHQSSRKAADIQRGQTNDKVGRDPLSSPVTNQGRSRIDSIDLLRGVVIVLMALDHARGYFGPAPYGPEDLSRASAFLFLTRWVTHFCAPVFVFLAGLGTALLQARGKSRAEISQFLVSRGVWLVFIELTVINLSWLDFYYGDVLTIQVIWALGISMILLAGMIWLPRWQIAALAIALVAGHNLFDGIQPDDLGGWAPVWGVLHAHYRIPLTEDLGVFTLYPLVPWMGVMALGYLAGSLYELEPERRRRLLARLGVGLTIAFIALRLVNLYGDPHLWSVQEKGFPFTMLSFLNTTKYPASLLFLLMTLGPALWLLAYLEKVSGSVARFFVLFGRVPFFFYIAHVPLIHAGAALWFWTRHGTVGPWFRKPWESLDGYEPNLFVVYAAWVLVVLALYPLCRWFAGVKRRSPNPWLKYL